MVYLVINNIAGFLLIWFSIENLLKFKDELLSLALDGVSGGDLRLMLTQIIIAALALWLGYNILVHKIAFAAHVIH